MAYLNLITCFWTLNLFCVCILKVTCNSVNEPSESAISYSYSSYTLEDYCEKEEDSHEFYIEPWKAAILHFGKIINPDGTLKGRNIHWCKISIKTKEGFWLTSAIEHMKIRGNRDSNNRWQCKDFIQFFSPARLAINALLSILNLDHFNRKKSEKLCGNKQLDGSHFENIFDVSTDANSFSTASNQMTISLHQDDREKLGINNSFTLVITTFRHASEEVECKEKLKCYGREVYCIDKNFMCDGHVNCAFPRSGSDENCPSEAKGFHTTSIIIIALVTTVALAMCVCVVSIVICKLRSWFCAVEQPRESNLGSTSLSLGQYPTAPSVEPESTLPPYDSAISLHHSDSKDSMGLGMGDLPPKYESLFPDRGVSPSESKEATPNSI